MREWTQELEGRFQQEIIDALTGDASKDVLFLLHKLEFSRTENQRLRTALEFYADEANWSNKQPMAESKLGIVADISNKISNKDLSQPRGGKGCWFKVAGRIAREALSESEASKEREG